MKNVELKLIAELMKNSRRSDREIAKALGVSQPTVSRLITKLQKEGVIKDFIAGEDFSIFNDAVLSLLEAMPELRGDPDLDATNEGVTILWLK